MRFLKVSGKILITTLIVTSTQAVFAKKYYKDQAVYKDAPIVAGAQSYQALHDGMYVGGQIGYDSYWVRQNISLPAPNDISGNPRINAVGLAEGIFVGYGQYFNELFYLGGEVLGNYSQANQSYTLTSSIGSYASKLTVNGTFGVSVLPGLKINDTSLVYIRLGYNWTNFKATESAVGVSTSKSSTQSGINYGLGLETLLIDSWSVRADYVHSNYSSFTTPTGTKFEPSDNQIMVGVLYHFNL